MICFLGLIDMARTLTENVRGIMAYLRMIEPKRDRAAKILRADLDAVLDENADLRSRLDQLEARVSELEDELL